jgi:hypothetical protein
MVSCVLRYLNSHLHFRLPQGPPLGCIKDAHVYWALKLKLVCCVTDICQRLDHVRIPWPPLWSSGQSSWLQNGDVLCFLWGTNWIYICYVDESGLPLWSSGQSSWLQNGDVLCFLWGTNWPPLSSSGHSSWLQFQRSGVSIPCTTRFSEKYWFWNGVWSASWIQLRSYLKEKVTAPV